MKLPKQKALAVQSFMLHIAFADKSGENFSETFQYYLGRAL